MTGRHSGPFNLNKSPGAKQALVKNYASKLLSTVDRQMDRIGLRFAKAVSRHGGLIFTVSVNKTGPRPIYKVQVRKDLVINVSEEPTSEIPCFLLSGLYSILGYAINAPIVDSDIAEQEGYTEFN